jgi:DNA-binding beta-propeller fold protein YncE
MHVRAEVYLFDTKWGTSGSGNSQFSDPLSIAVDSSGNVYVADGGNSRIQKFTDTGIFLRTWGSFGSGDDQFRWPFGVAVDSSGNVYVADSYNHRIQKFTAEGFILKTWGSFGTGEGQFSRLSGVAVDSSGNVYVADSYNHRIQKFTSEGVFVKTWGSVGSSNGLFNIPAGVAVDSSGNVYVADSYNHRIQKFTSEGVFVKTWGSVGTGDSQFSYPLGVAIDNSGNVYIADTDNSRIQVFNSDGNLLTKWGSTGSGDGQFVRPQGIAVDSSKNIFVSDTQNNRIQKFKLENVLTPALSSTPTPPPATTNLGISSFWIEAIFIAVIIILPVTAFVIYKLRNRRDGFRSPLPSGWQFYAKPTEAEKPGTVFRITSGKKKFWVGELPVRIRECDVSTGRYLRKTTINVFLRFTELNNIEINSRGKKVQRLDFEMKDPKDETTFDVDLDPLLKQLFENLAYHKEDQYFIIRDATKTQEINYQLTEDHVNSLGGEASFRSALEERCLSSSKEQEMHIIKQKFEKPMRIMFNAEELKMRLDKNGNMRFSFHRVKKVLDWT